MKVLSENLAEPEPCVRSDRANFQPWQPLLKFLGRRSASEGGEQIEREGKEAVEERGRGEKGLVTQGYGVW